MAEKNIDIALESTAQEILLTAEEIQAAVNTVKTAIDAGFSVDLSGISLVGKQIKGIQYKTVDMSSKDTDVTITSVNTARTMLILLGFTGDTSSEYFYMNYYYPRITLKNSTTVTVSVFVYAPSKKPIVNFAVVEFY